MILSLFLRISEIYCLFTPYSVDKLVPFSNRKIIADCLSSMGRMDCSLFVHTDKFVLTQKLAHVLQTKLIELLMPEISEPIRAQ